MNNALTKMYNTNYTKLSKSEKHCFDYMVKIQKKLIIISIQDLAFETNTSTATIRRMIGKLGYTSFKDFKNSLVEEKEMNILSDFDYHLIELITQFDTNLISEGAEKIKNCKGNIHIFAFGATIGTAYDLIIGLKKLGYQSSLVSENDLFIPTLRDLYTEDDLIIYISFSGNSERLVTAASILNGYCQQLYIGANPRGKIGEYVEFHMTTDFYTPNYEVRARAPLNIIVAKLLLYLNELKFKPEE